jgi:hypothetical protein
MSILLVNEIHSLGSDAGRGNLLGIQPYMTASDYVAEEPFYARLDGYLQAARQEGWLGEKTVVVFPELIGAWLVAAGESQRVFQARTINAAMRSLVLRHAIPFAGKLAFAREKDRVVASLFRMKAGQMARLYQAVFSRLARQYGVTVVAGSIYLPVPYVEEGLVRAGGGTGSAGRGYRSADGGYSTAGGYSSTGGLFNTSVVFRPDGQAHSTLVRKCYPIATEQGFVSAASVADLPVFETPAGKLGVLVCADSWYPQAYEQLKEGGVEMVAVPSLAAGAGIWEKPWGGYISADCPQDVDRKDVGRLTEGQAWRKYALSARIGASGARCGVNVFLHGELWDLGVDNGNSLAVREGEIVEARKNGGALLNVWL